MLQTQTQIDQGHQFNLEKVQIAKIEKWTPRPGGLVDEFINAQDVRDSSKQTYKRALKQFMLFIDEAGIMTQFASGTRREFFREDILNYKRHLETLELSPYTVSSYLVVVRKFFAWCESMKLYPNIARDIKGAKKPNGFRKDVLTVDQISQLLSSIPRDTTKGKRDFALLTLLIHTGLRVREVALADIDDIEEKGNEAILYVQGKGRDTKDAFCVLTPSVLSPLREYLQTRGTPEKKEPLFVSRSNHNLNQRLTAISISAIVKSYLRTIGIDDKRYSAHSLRHTAITLALVGGATIQEVQGFARHSNINTTLIYAHNISRFDSAPERKIDKVLQGNVA